MKLANVGNQKKERLYSRVILENNLSIKKQNVKYMDNIKIMNGTGYIHIYVYIHTYIIKSRDTIFLVPYFVQIKQYSLNLLMENTQNREK